MARPSSNRTDRTGQEYLDVAATMFRDRLRDTDSALTSMFGFVALADVQRIVGGTTGAFYRRWGKVEEFNADLTQHVVTEAFASPVRKEILNTEARAIVKREGPDAGREEILGNYQQVCAEAVAAGDPHLLVRWHARPHVGLEADDPETLQVAEMALVVTDAWLGSSPPDQPALEQEAGQLVRAIDFSAIEIFAHARQAT